MFTLINGSPRNNRSNSKYFLSFIEQKLDNYNLFYINKDKFCTILDSISISDAIVFSFPLYVDSEPSSLLSFMDYIIDNNIDISNKKVYAVVNCGFLEGEQNITAIEIIKRWCYKTNTIYSGSILIGAGEIVGKKKYQLITKKALKELNIFAENVLNQKKFDDIITTMSFMNPRLYCTLANISWSKNGRKNGLSNDELRMT